MLHYNHRDAQQNLRELLTGVAEQFRHGYEYTARAMLSEGLPGVLISLLTLEKGGGDVSTGHNGQKEFVVHYTTMRAVVDMLTQIVDNKSDGFAPAFRMYHAEGFSDPSEGTAVTQFYKHLSDEYKWLKLPPEHSAYACSFAAPKTADDLMFWRLYGDNGMGCSIRVASHDVVSNLFPVQYWDENQERDSSLRIREVLKAINTIAIESPAIGEICGDAVASLLNLYRYYVKSHHYEHEKEYRFVRVKNDAHGVEFDKQNIPRIRRYISEGAKLADIFSSGTAITIGPQAKTPHAVKAYIEHLLKKAGRSSVVVSKSLANYRTP